VTAAGAGSERITIRKCEGIDELKACVAMQKEVWSFDDADLVPLRIFVVGQKIGGQVIGAFDGNELQGFAFSIPGERGGHPYLHSHIWRCARPGAITGWGAASSWRKEKMPSSRALS